KLIRRTLSKWDKSRVQGRLQAAYQKNAEGFYVNAPKRSRTKLKGLLEYISRYMKRGPIAVRRIFMYDGEVVMFHYQEKRTNTQETKIMSVKEFISALIRHIPDPQFKTIRRYGIYSRRLKTLMDKVLIAYQTLVKKMFVNLHKILKPKSWAKRIAEEFGEDPLQCSHCGEYYECLGMSVRKKGRLQVQYAKNPTAREYMKKENRKIEEESFEIKYEKEKAAAFKAIRFDWERQRQLFLPYMRGERENSYGDRPLFG